MLLNIVILIICFIIMCLVIINKSPNIINYVEEQFKNIN
jgi:hypothetical protein